MQSAASPFQTAASTSREQPRQSILERPRGEAEHLASRHRIAHVVLLKHLDLIPVQRRCLIQHPGKHTLEKPRLEPRDRQREMDHPPVASRGLKNHPDHLIERIGTRPTQIQRPSHRTRCPRRRSKTMGHILNRHGLDPGLTRADDRQDGGPLGHAGEQSDKPITRPVDQTGPEDRPVEPTGPDRLLSLPFGPMIPGHGVRSGPEGTHVDEAAEARRSGSIQHVPGPLGVDPFEGLIPHLADDAHEMEDRIDALTCRREGLGAQDRALDGLDGTPLGGPGPSRQDPDGMAPGQQSFDDGPTDKTRTACDEDLHLWAA